MRYALYLVEVKVDRLVVLPAVFFCLTPDFRFVSLVDRDVELASRLQQAQALADNVVSDSFFLDDIEHVRQSDSVEWACSKSFFVVSAVPVVRVIHIIVYSELRQEFRDVVILASAVI